MSLSVAFSLAFYKNSVDAAANGLNRQVAQLKQRIGVNPSTSFVFLENLKNKELNGIKREIAGRLLLLNAVMLAGGSYLSVYLARKSLRPMEEALEAQSRFSSDASHELRTPLTSIKTEIEVALRSKNLSVKEAKEVLGSTLEEVNDLETLTTALLRLSTYDQKMPSHDKVQLKTVIQRGYDRISKLADKHAIKFNLPVTKLKTFGDSDQLSEVFVVLFDNAIKYGKDNSEVNVTAIKEDNTVVIKVQDQGVGILPTDIQHVFERFYRADQSRTKNKTSGHGLGLSLAQTIIEAHQGSISVESEVDKGTTFIISLPAAE